jgi:hypothetical protein
MNRKLKLPENTEFAGIDAALRRAAKAAHTLARKTKTPCYIWKDGQIVDITKQKKNSSPSRAATKG